jgi:hypothetical protein
MALPVITSLSPSSGLNSGVVHVLITGTDLGSASAVEINSDAMTVLSNSATEIVATVPASLSGGIKDIYVTTAGGISVATDYTEFTVIAKAVGDTFKTLYDYVIAKLRNSSTGAVTRAKMEVNLAIKEICGMLPWQFLYSIGNTLTGTGVSYYSFDSSWSVGKIVGVRYDGSILRQVDLHTLKTNERTSTITKYAVSGETIYLDCNLTAGEELEVDYLTKADTLSADAELCVIPSEWTHAVVQLAFAHLLEDDDDTRHKDAYVKANKLISDMRKYYFSSPDDESMMIPGGSLNA